MQLQQHLTIKGIVTIFLHTWENQRDLNQKQGQPSLASAKRLWSLLIYRYLYIFDSLILKREIRTNTASIKMNVKLPCRQAKQCFDLCQNFEFSMARIVYKLAYAHLKWFNPKWNQRINNETKRGTGQKPWSYQSYKSWPSSRPASWSSKRYRQ